MLSLRRAMIQKQKHIVLKVVKSWENYKRI